MLMLSKYQHITSEGGGEGEGSDRLPLQRYRLGKDSTPIRVNVHAVTMIFMQHPIFFAKYCVMRNILTFSHVQIKFRVVKLGTVVEVTQTCNTERRFE